MKNENLRKAQRLFNKSANLWIEANNNSNADQESLNAKRNNVMDNAERLVKDVYPDIIIDYPGLYPAFQLNGAHFYNLESLEFYNEVKQ